jgi:hypothetical protein
MGEGERSCAEVEENDVRSSPEEDRGGAASTVGEGEEGGVKNIEPGRRCSRPGLIVISFVHAGRIRRS